MAVTVRMLFRSLCKCECTQRLNNVAEVGEGGVDRNSLLLGGPSGPGLVQSLGTSKVNEVKQAGDLLLFSPVRALNVQLEDRV